MPARRILEHQRYCCGATTMRALPAKQEGTLSQGARTNRLTAPQFYQYRPTAAVQAGAIYEEVEQLLRNN